MLHHNAMRITRSLLIFLCIVITFSVFTLNVKNVFSQTLRTDLDGNRSSYNQRYSHIYQRFC